jgi:hypothetical protein
MICNKNGFIISSGLKRIVHLDASLGQNDIILHTMENIHWDAMHLFGICRVVASADGDSCRELVRSPLQCVPNTESTHRDACNVNVICINCTTNDETINQMHYVKQLSRWLAFHLMLGQTPIGVHPTFSFMALWNQQKKRILVCNGVVEKIIDAMFQLSVVVVSAFSCAVQKNHQWHRFCCRLSLFRTK